MNAAKQPHRAPEDETDEAPDAPTGKPAGDARDDPEKLKENRDKLGVDEDHQTPDMKEKHRGTFP